MAGPASTLDVRANLVFIAQRDRGLLRHSQQAAIEARGFRSVVDLQAAINRFLDEYNAEPKRFIWTTDPDKIIAGVRARAPGVSWCHWSKGPVPIAVQGTFHEIGNSAVKLKTIETSRMSLYFHWIIIIWIEA